METACSKRNSTSSDVDSVEDQTKSLQPENGGAIKQNDATAVLEHDSMVSHFGRMILQKESTNFETSDTVSRCDAVICTCEVLDARLAAIAERFGEGVDTITEGIEQISDLLFRLQMDECVRK